MKKKGFTLVELLAVITLLGLLGLIIVPIVTNTIEKQRKGAFEASVNGILDLAKNKSQNNDFNEIIYSWVQLAAHLIGFNRSASRGQLVNNAYVKVAVYNKSQRAWYWRCRHNERMRVNTLT